MPHAPDSSPVRPRRRLLITVLPATLAAVLSTAHGSGGPDVLAWGLSAAAQAAATPASESSAGEPPARARSDEGSATPFPVAPAVPAEPGQEDADTTAAARASAQGEKAPPAPPGSLEPVPTRPVRTLPPVALDSSAAFGTGVLAKISRLQPVGVVGQGPGELSGPGVAVHVELVNETQHEIPLHVIVSMNRGRDTEAVPSSQPPARLIEGVLAPGATASGVYVFVVPPEEHGNFRVRVSYAPGNPVVVFRAG